MNREYKGKKGLRIGILVKILGIFSALLLLAVVTFTFITINSIRRSNFETVAIMGNNTLRGGIAYFASLVYKKYGQLNLKDDSLVGDNGLSLKQDYTIVDHLSSDLRIEATVFVRENDDYRRITTSIVDSSGRRVIDTLLGQKSAAYEPIHSGNAYNGRATILGKEYLTAYMPIFAPNTKDVIGILFVGVEMTSIEETINIEIFKEVKKIIIIAVVILLLSIIVNALTCRFMLLRPIISTVHMLKEISEGEGDLTKRLIVKSNDEIGDMSNYFNLTMEKVKNLIISIKKEAAALLDIGNDLASNMAETASVINQITGNIQSIEGRVINQSASVNETNATMEQITVNINKLNAHVERQSYSVAQSSSAIEEMLANIQSVTRTLVKNSENVKELSTASEVGREGLQGVVSDIKEIASESDGLLEINSVMQNIASQTNLLSMNAAIEAAHAGESGKGFAVVADEIRKLAENSGVQSKTISTVLKKIKSSIDKITQSTENVLNKFGAIDNSVKIVAEQEENIRNAMEEQSQGSKQILEAIGQVNEITQHVKSGSTEMLDASKEISQEGKNLEKVTQEITEGMNEMSSGAGEINQAVNMVNDISRKNKESIDILVQEVSRFKAE